MSEYTVVWPTYIGDRVRGRGEPVSFGPEDSEHRDALLAAGAIAKGSGEAEHAAADKLRQAISALGEIDNDNHAAMVVAHGELTAAHDQGRG